MTIDIDAEYVFVRSKGREKQWLIDFWYSDVFYPRLVATQVNWTQRLLRPTRFQQQFIVKIYWLGLSSLIGVFRHRLKTYVFKIRNFGRVRFCPNRTKEADFLNLNKLATRMRWRPQAEELVAFGIFIKTGIRVFCTLMGFCAIWVLPLWADVCGLIARNQYTRHMFFGCCGRISCVNVVHRYD